MFTIDPKVLSVAYNRVKSIADTKSGIPILSMALVEVSGGTMSLVMSDADIEAEIKIPCGGSFGPLAIAPHLLETAAAMPGHEVTIEASDRVTTIRAGRAKFSAPHLDATDFPRHAAVKGDVISMVGKDLAKILDHTRGAVSDDKSRYYLHGPLLEIADGRLIAVATDGHRFHKVETGIDRGATLPPNMIIPPKAAAEFVRFASAVGDDHVTLTASKSLISLETTDAKLTSKLIDGTYPDWRRIIPLPCDDVITFDIAEMSAALSRIMKVPKIEMTGKTRKIGTVSSIKIAAGENEVTIAASSMDGDGEDVIAAEVEGEWGERYVHPKLLKDVLEVAALRGLETIRIDAGAPQSPLRCIFPGDENFFAIVMPRQK